MMFNYFPVNSDDFAEDYWPWKFDASRTLFHQMESSMVLEWIILGTAKHATWGNIMIWTLDRQTGRRTDRQIYGRLLW